MLKKLIVAGALTISMGALATTSFGDWVQDSEETLSGETPKEIQTILQRGEVNFGWLQAEYLNRAMTTPGGVYLTRMWVQVYKFHFEGQTTCAPNDARLKVTRDGGSTSFSDGAGLAWAFPVPTGTDPCHSVGSPAKRTIRRL